MENVKKLDTDKEPEKGYGTGQARREQIQEVLFHFS
jgi:hypothetical protein